MSIKNQSISISSSSCMSIKLKVGITLTISFGEIAKGSLWSSSTLKSLIWLSNNGLPILHFVPFIKTGNQSILAAINNKDKWGWFYRICHHFCQNVFPRFEYPLHHKPPWNWLRVSRSHMFCLSQPIIIPFLESVFKRSIKKKHSAQQLPGKITVPILEFMSAFNIVSQMSLIRVLH